MKPTGEEPETPDDSSKTNGKDRSGRVIAVIDDDPGVVNLYRRFLEKRNYRIVEIDNSEDVTAQVKIHAPSAILLDILMPDKDGWSIIKDLKQDPYTKDIPVIICSIISDKNRGFSLGAADYLTKPIVEGELVNALKNLYDQQKEQIKVLVIDDQADDILLIRRILEAHDYKIIEAGNGREGIDLAQSRNPDLIILDLSMPEMDGFAVVDVLKNDKKMREIPIIIVSAVELTAAEQEFLTGQVEVLLRKGIFTENELLKDVSQALEKFQTQPEPW
jgi:CheY-like chemotaxis protein